MRTTLCSAGRLRLAFELNGYILAADLPNGQTWRHRWHEHETPGDVANTAAAVRQWIDPSGEELAALIEWAATFTDERHAMDAESVNRFGTPGEL